MRSRPLFAMAVALSLANVGGATVYAPQTGGDEFEPRYRSKGKRSKPARKPNRNHISRRVRRKHRRARRAA